MKKKKPKEHGKKMMMSFCIIIRKEATKPLKPPSSAPTPPKPCPICYVWARWHALSESLVSWRRGTIFSSNISKGAGEGWEGDSQLN
jgi:hypothetical protein